MSCQKVQSGPPGDQGGAQPGRAAAANQEIAVGVELLVAVRIRPGQRAAKPCRAAHQPLPGLPVGPLEGLVVKTGRPQPVREIDDSSDIETDGWPAMLAPRDEAVGQRHHRRPAGRHARIALADLDQCAGFLLAGGIDPSGAMVLEAPGDDADVIGQQGGGQRVACIAEKMPAVESESQRPGAVDNAAVRQPAGLGTFSPHSEPPDSPARPSTISASRRAPRIS